MGAAEGWLPAPQPPRPVESSVGREFAEDLPDDVEVWLLVAFDGVDVGVLFPEAAQRAPESRHGVAVAVELAHDDGEFNNEVGEGSYLVVKTVEVGGEDVVARARVDEGVVPYEVREGDAVEGWLRALVVELGTKPGLGAAVLGEDKDVEEGDSHALGGEMRVGLALEREVGRVVVLEPVAGVCGGEEVG